VSELLKVGVMASGGGTDLQSIIDACREAKAPAAVAVVISNKADAYALERARQHGIPALHIPVGKTGGPQWEEADARHVEVFREHGVQLVCMAGYMRKIGPRLLEAFPGAIMNIHPALLPAFPGVEVQWDAVEYGVKVAGATVHFADAEFDRGPIIIQAAVPVNDDDDGEALARRILEQEHRIYPQAVKWFAEGRLEIEGRRVRLLDPDPDAPPQTAGVIISPPLEAGF
jgi:phosphoribosylglycinamide formyltransferase-1